MGDPEFGSFKRENPIEMDDLGAPPFQETTILGYDVGIFRLEHVGKRDIFGSPNYMMLENKEY